MNILGLDLSVTGTGICLLNSTEVLSKKFFSKTLNGDKKLFECEDLTVEQINISRLIYIEDEIKELLNGVDFVVIENYAFDAKFNRERLGELHGVIKRLLYKNNIPFILVDTAKLKKVLTGNSHNPTSLKVKQWVLNSTKERFLIDFENRDDECDAFGLALIGLFYKDINLIDKLEVSKEVKEDISLVINRMYENKNANKKVKKNLSYYFNLKYNTVCRFKDNQYVSYIEYFDVFGYGNTLKKSLLDLEKNKRLKIREMKKNKQRITYPTSQKAKISYIIKKNE